MPRDTNTIAEPTHAWNVQQMISDLGGPKGVMAIMAQEGITPPTMQNVLMWRLRARVPHDWLPTVLRLLAKHKSPFDLDRYLLALSS